MCQTKGTNSNGWLPEIIPPNQSPFRAWSYLNALCNPATRSTEALAGGPALPAYGPPSAPHKPTPQATPRSTRNAASEIGKPPKRLAFCWPPLKPAPKRVPEKQAYTPKPQLCLPPLALATLPVAHGQALPGFLAVRGAGRRCATPLPAVAPAPWQVFAKRSGFGEYSFA